MFEKKEKQNYWVDTIKERKNDISQLMPTIIENKEDFFKNTEIAIKRDPDLLKYTWNQTSCIKLVTEIEKLARIGLTIGGHKPQAYIVPFGDNPVAIPTANGYKFVVTAGKLPLFKSVELYKIFKDDKFELDEANGVFNKMEKSGADFNVNENDFAGFVFVAIFKDGEKVVKKITRNTIDNQHKRFSKQANGATWTNHYMRMAEKSAIKHALSDYIYMCEGLANMEDFEGVQYKQTTEEKSKIIDADAFTVPAPKEEKDTEKKPDDKKEDDGKSSNQKISELL